MPAFVPFAARALHRPDIPRCRHIQPEAALAMFSLEDMVKADAQAGIVAKFFTEAMRWIESQS
jgi:hypothetical protein